jgi:hypothetical protein
MDQITLNVPQGVGDIFWVYQKFSTYAKKINFNILCTAIDKVQERAKDWLTLLPKTGTVRMKLIPADYYQSVISQHYKMDRIMPILEKGFEADYSANKPLEDGVRLEDIDPEYVVESPVDVRTDFCTLPYEKFMTLYVSGGTKKPDVQKLAGVWNMKYWYDFVLAFRSKYGLTLPLVIVGANYDADVSNHLSAMLKVAKVENSVFIDSYPGNVAWILKHSKVFLGYQSGLSILADNFSTPQVMLYFPFLAKMMNTWCRKENIGRVFHADVFSTPPKEAVSKCNLELKA